MSAMYALDKFIQVVSAPVMRGSVKGFFWFVIFWFAISGLSFSDRFSWTNHTNHKKANSRTFKGFLRQSFPLLAVGWFFYGGLLLNAGVNFIHAIEGFVWIWFVFLCSVCIVPAIRHYYYKRHPLKKEEDLVELSFRTFLSAFSRGVLFVAFLEGLFWGFINIFRDLPSNPDWDKQLNLMVNGLQLVSEPCFLLGLVFFAFAYQLENELRTHVAKAGKQVSSLKKFIYVSGAANVLGLLCFFKEFALLFHTSFANAEKILIPIIALAFGLPTYFAAKEKNILRKEDERAAS